MKTYRAVVEIGQTGSWSQCGYLSRFDALAAARQYIKDHPEVKDRAYPLVESEHPPRWYCSKYCLEHSVR